MQILYFVLFIFNFHKVLTNADISELFYIGDVSLSQHADVCSKILDDFAETSSNFTMCSIQYARPVNLCKKCINHYINFQDRYDKLLNTVVNGTSCRSIFIANDRLEVVLAFHDSILAVWNKGNCNACFNWSAKYPVLSNSTLKFNKLFDDTHQCITKNFKPNDTNEVCITCMHPYLNLNNYYETLSSNSIAIDSICVDIVDSMNLTRSFWSKNLKCCLLRKTPEVIFLCCSIIITILPMLYYLVLRYCGTMRELPNILKQTRFKQTFLRSSTSSSDVLIKQQDM